jgi:ribosome-associated heat shock protein Hsp15
MPTMGDGEGRVRLDRWLWAARFFKTRSLASAAISGGHVHAEDKRAKPSRAVAIGDRLTITRGQTTWHIVVRGLSDRRGPASEAVLLYEETEESARQRERAAAERRAGQESVAARAGRPSKRDRRRMDRLTGRRR